MIHAVEVTTTHKDGRQTIMRVIEKSFAEAKELGFELAAEFDKRPEHNVFVNDFGESVFIEYKEYGKAAQVTEGIFVF